jgi:hypothetical protein
LQARRDRAAADVPRQLTEAEFEEIKKFGGE